MGSFPVRLPRDNLLLRSELRFAVLPIRSQITPQCRTGMTGNGVRIRILRMGLSEIPSGQDLCCPQAFSGAQVPLDSFFQLAAPEDPTLQLFSAFGLVNSPMGCQFFEQSFQSHHSLILRQTQKIQQLMADRIRNPQILNQFQTGHSSAPFLRLPKRGRLPVWSVFSSADASSFEAEPRA